MRNVVLTAFCAIVLALAAGYVMYNYQFQNGLRFSGRPEAKWASHPMVIDELSVLILEGGGPYYRGDLVPINVIDNVKKQVSNYTYNGLNEFSPEEIAYIKTAVSDRLITWEECQDIYSILDEVALRIMVRDLNKDHNQKVDQIIDLFN